MNKMGEKSQDTWKQKKEVFNLPWSLPGRFFKGKRVLKVDDEKGADGALAKT